jgi:hypothetical protein
VCVCVCACVCVMCDVNARRRDVAHVAHNTRHALQCDNELALWCDSITPHDFAVRMQAVGVTVDGGASVLARCECDTRPTALTACVSNGPRIVWLERSSTVVRVAEPLASGASSSVVWTLSSFPTQAVS